MPVAATIAAVSVGVGAAGQILSAKAKAKASRRASKTTADAQNRLIDLQERLFDRADPFFALGQGGLEKLFASIGTGPIGQDQQLQDEFNALDQELAKQGLAFGGVSEDLKLKAAGRATDRRFAKRSNAVRIALGQGSRSESEAAGVARPIAGLSGDLANLQLGRGRIQSDLFGGLGGLPLQGNALFESLSEEGPSAIANIPFNN